MLKNRQVQIIDNPSNIKYHDPLGGYPDLVVKTKIPDEIVMTRVASRPKIETLISKICIFRGDSKANKFYQEFKAR